MSVQRETILFQYSISGRNATGITEDLVHRTATQLYFGNLCLVVQSSFWYRSLKLLCMCLERPQFVHMYPDRQASQPFSDHNTKFKACERSEQQLFWFFSKRTSIRRQTKCDQRECE